MSASNSKIYAKSIEIVNSAGASVGTIESAGSTISVAGTTSAKSVYSASINSVVVITIRAANSAVYGGSGAFIAIPASGNYDPNTYGYVLTAGHVVVDPTTNQICNDIWIHVSYPAIASYKVNGSSVVVMGVDKIADVALLRITGSGFVPLSYKDSRTGVTYGDNINIIGYPLLEDIQSITRGVVRDYKYSDEFTPEAVYTDASIFGGNSGGPVITDDGKVVGILSFGITGTDSMNGAVASYLFAPIIRYFMDNYAGSPVSFPKGYLGISYNYVGPTFPMTFSNLNVGGVRVNAFDATVPKYFNFSDIITEIDGNRIGAMNSQFPFFTEVHLRRPTSTMQVKYIPYISSTTSYGNFESTVTATLSVFNPANDVFLSTVHYYPVPAADTLLTIERFH